MKTDAIREPEINPNCKGMTRFCRAMVILTEEVPPSGTQPSAAASPPAHSSPQETPQAKTALRDKTDSAAPL